MKHHIFYYTRLIWVKSMRLGAASGCHQLPERSFYFKKYQFPVCARCCGALIGEAAAALCAFKKQKTNSAICFLAAMTMLFDWLLQYIDKLESTNIRRFVSGILGGFGCWSLFFKLLDKIWQSLKNISERA